MALDLGPRTLPRNVGTARAVAYAKGGDRGDAVRGEMGRRAALGRRLRSRIALLPRMGEPSRSRVPRGSKGYCGLAFGARSAAPRAGGTTWRAARAGPIPPGARGGHSA